MAKNKQREWSQWYTPPELAERIVKWSCVLPFHTILEPSAGKGALLAPLPPTVSIDAFEIDPFNCAALRIAGASVFCEDFLTSDGCNTLVRRQRYDLCLMNPPYEHAQDVAFAAKALRVCDRVVGLFQSRIMHSQRRLDFWVHTQINRMAVLSKRPNFGGEYSPKTDYVVLELTKLTDERNPTQIEWW